MCAMYLQSNHSEQASPIYYRWLLRFGAFICKDAQDEYSSNVLNTEPLQIEYG